MEYAHGTSGKDPFEKAREGWLYDPAKIGSILSDALDAATLRLKRRRIGPDEAKAFVRALCAEFAPDEVLSRQHRMAFRSYCDVGEIAGVCMEHLQRIGRGYRLQERTHRGKLVHGDQRAVAFLRRWFDIPEPPKKKKRRIPAFREPPSDEEYAEV